MKVCKASTCDESSVDGFECCILHIDKTSYSEPGSDSFGDFGKAIKEKIIKHIDEILSVDGRDGLAVSSARRAALDSLQKTNATRLQLNTGVIRFDEVDFPCDGKGGAIGLEWLLSKLDGIEFNRCVFNSTSIPIVNTKAVFKNCRFNSYFVLQDYLIPDDCGPAVFQNCIFVDGVGTKIENNELQLSLSCSQFSCCSFGKVLNLKNVVVEEPLFLDSESGEGDTNRDPFEAMLINDCNFKDRFVFNCYKVGRVEVTDSLFKKAEFKHGVFDWLRIENSNFQGIADFFESEIHGSLFEKMVFSQQFPL